MLQHLFEKQDYMEMVKDIHPEAFVQYVASKVSEPVEKDKRVHELYEQLIRLIAPVRKTLKRNDRIVWFIRIMKMYYIHSALEILLGSNTHSQYRTIIDSIKFVSTYKKKAPDEYPSMVYDMTHEKYFGQYFGTLLSRLDHYVNQGIPELEEYVFGYESPLNLEEKFQQLEKDYIERMSRVIPFAKQPFEDVEIVIDFGDGFYWVDLGKGSCAIEGKAMGHCGNVPSEKFGDAILSLRKVNNKNE
jgi:hypothetical protein